MSLFDATEELNERRQGEWGEEFDVSIDREPEYGELERAVSRLNDDTENLIIAIGPTGSGKTTLVQQCLSEGTPFESFESTVIDCADSGSVYRTFIRTVNAFRQESNSLSPSGYSFDAVRDRLRDELTTGPYPTIICFDGIQNLDALSPVCSLTTIPDTHVVCTADVEDPAEYASLEVNCNTTVITFQRYTVEQLRTLFKMWTQEGGEEIEFSADAILLCAAYAAEDGGNARLGIELLKRASSIVLAASDAQVRARHVQRAKEEYETETLQTEFDALDEHGQLVLNALVHLSKTNDAPARTSTVYDEYSSLAARADVEPIARRRMSDRLQELESREFVSYVEYNDGRSGGKYREYELEPDPAFFELNVAATIDGVAVDTNDSLF